MIGKKLVKILQTLDPAAFRRLGDAFASPYFTRSALLLKLYNILKKEYPGFEVSRLNKEKVFNALFPEKPFNDGLLRVFVHEFTKITEDFLLFESFKNDDNVRQKLLTQWYGDHNMYAEFQKGTQAMLAQLEKKPYRDVEYFSAAKGLYISYFFHMLTEKYTINDEVLTRLMECVEGEYVLLNLRLTSEMKNREHILAKQYEPSLLNEVRTADTLGVLQNNVPFLLYRKLLMIHETDGHQEDFQIFKALLFQHIEQLRYFDQSMLLTQIINYAIRQMNKGYGEYKQEVFNLYQLALKHQLVLSNGKIEITVYQNIVSSGCKANEFSWTEQFIHEYAAFLEDDIREEGTSIALALLYFHESYFDRTIEMIRERRFSNVILQMNMRLLLTKAWFEKFVQDHSYYDLLISQLETNEKFIRRNTVISKAKKEGNLNFFIIVKHLVEMFTNKRPTSDIRSWFEKRVSANQHVLAKEWLYLKIDEYEMKQRPHFH